LAAHIYKLHIFLLHNFLTYICNNLNQCFVVRSDYASRTEDPPRRQIKSVEPTNVRALSRVDDLEMDTGSVDNKLQ